MKTAYVGVRDAELTIMVTPHEVSATVDLALPQVPAFSLRIPSDHCSGEKAYLFHEMITMLQAHLVKYLLAVGVPQDLVDKTYYAMVKAVESSESGDSSKSDRSGVGGDPLLERVVSLEPLEVYEIRWPLPEGLTESLHQKVVTASVPKKVNLPQRGPHPGGFSHGHAPSTRKQNYPSVRNLVQKFRGQQGKTLTGPVFVLVYDVQGRPIGVRSIKGPNWGWVQGKSALFHRKQAGDVPPDTGRRVMVDPTHEELSRVLTDAGSVRVFLSPDGSRLYALGAEDGGLSEIRKFLEDRESSPSEWIPLAIFPDGEVEVTESSRRTRWWRNPLVAEVIQESSALAKALGSNPHRISYYDQASNEDWSNPIPPASGAAHVQ